MEPVGAISEGEWGSLSGMYTTEEAEFMAQLLGNCSSFPNELDGGSSLGIPSAFWAAGHESVNKSLYCSSDAANTNLYCFSQGSSSYSGGSSLFPNSSQGSYYLSDSQQVLGGNNSAMSMDFCIGDDKNNSLAVQVFADSLMEGDEYCLNVEECRRNFPEMPELPSATEDKNNKMPENSKKRMRDSGDVQKNKRNVKKKSQKSVSSNNEEDNNGGVVNGQSSSSCSSEDESIASQELNGSSSPKGSAALNSKDKARASRGSATDPQSLYARKRRERINERLKILQNLVPNGTKVDISTMLEEAVEYVKFLQLQIKLLSSDDLWMYAPLAYNGMDIGLDLKISMPRK
ncbi:hypothetical protein VitviT2T_003645 [Vitis vinifera]|uniref:BHLH domain-containing protein n=2 Tax=Vitis vinifera TaxID=29760 RepID=A0ABY9BML1_VITVI|nr:transcription factor bHLH139 [Vitis vinifera]RVW72423.1 Transcription factor bHLH84 [Vitis vinifera]WJZ84014.1 hypothetical protein VitviT2T_003645 [Vitis vinifera]|eukprot:XP_002264083.1 PREDICTED: transcription factor bHLH139 [Vitis vinifera]